MYSQSSTYMQIIKIVHSQKKVVNFSKNINLTNMQFTVHVYLANQMVRVQTQMIVTSVINLLGEYAKP